MDHPATFVCEAGVGVVGNRVFAVHHESSDTALLLSHSFEVNEMQCTTPWACAEVLRYQGAMVDNQRLAGVPCDMGPVTVGVAKVFFALAAVHAWRKSQHLRR